MSVARTDEWLEEFFEDTSKICSKLVPKQKDASDFYNYLQQFGMYRPNGRTKRIYLQLKEEDTWNKVQKIMNRYKQKWNGPDIPIYIFPIDERGKVKRKSGISFHDQMFLFLSPLEDEKELEALFIHEYHHVCRLQHLNKAYTEYTLLDSIVMEGLAEYTVFKYLGEKYTADWISRFNDEKLEFYWEKYFKKNCHIKRKEKLHEALLFGKGMFPDLIGYAVGYWLIEKIFQKRRFSLKESLTLPANTILKENV